MQTVYVPVNEGDQFDGSYTSNDGQSLCRLKETEAFLLSKEDADRVVNYQSNKDNEPFGELEKYLVYIKSQARVEICWCPDEKNGKWLAAESYPDTDHYIYNEDIILWASIPMPSPPKSKNK